MRPTPISNHAASATCRRLTSWLATLTLWLASLGGAWAQPGVSPGLPGRSPLDVPQTNLAPVAPPPSSFAPPSSGFGQFDPYASGATAGSTGFGSGFNPATIGPPTAVAPPSPPVTSAPAPSTGFGSFFSQPTAPPPPSLTPQFQPPQYQPPITPTPGLAPPSLGGFGDPYGTTGYAPPAGYATQSTFPSSVYPDTVPNSLFPEGVFSGGLFPASGEPFSAYRFLRGPRFRYTWVTGDNSKPDALQTHDFDTSVIFTFPNFCYSSQPFLLSPAFSLHLWDGPDGSTGADLPSRAYSAFLDAGWNSDPNRILGTELGVRVGVFTDFDTSNSNSVRVLGKGLVNFRLSPFSTLKAGVYYLDRNSVKLIPAGGIIYQPNPLNRYSIFFPEPKLAHFCRTVGTQDVWWYLAGGFGGGSWTIRRTDRTSDSVDINELRAIIGFEFGRPEQIRAGTRTGFFEFGYVFNREIEYRFNPQDNLKPGDAFMIRAGFGY